MAAGVDLGSVARLIHRTVRAILRSRRALKKQARPNEGPRPPVEYLHHAVIVSTEFFR